MRYNRLICNIINVIGTSPTHEETMRFNNEFLMGQSAQEYVDNGLRLIEKVNRDSEPDNND